MYYALAHFTKFLPEGSLRIHLATSEREKGKENLVLTDNGKSSEKRMNEVTYLEDIFTEYVKGTTTLKQAKKVHKAERSTSGRTRKKKEIRKMKKQEEQFSQYNPISHVAFLRPDNSTVAIFLNK